MLFGTSKHRYVYGHQPVANEAVVSVDQSAPSKKRQPSSIDVHVGKHLRARLVLANLSQSDLAKAADVTFQQIQKYEHGTNRMSAGQIYTFAKLLACTPNDFFDGYE